MQLLYLGFIGAPRITASLAVRIPAFFATHSDTTLPLILEHSATL
jgi:hypothetical protein